MAQVYQSATNPSLVELSQGSGVVLVEGQGGYPPCGHFSCQVDHHGTNYLLAFTSDQPNDRALSISSGSSW